MLTTENDYEIITVSKEKESTNEQNKIQFILERKQPRTYF